MIAWMEAQLEMINQPIESAVDRQVGQGYKLSGTMGKWDNSKR